MKDKHNQKSESGKLMNHNVSAISVNSLSQNSYILCVNFFKKALLQKKKQTAPLKKFIKCKKVAMRKRK